jgi:hypothetical protein
MKQLLILVISVILFSCNSNSDLDKILSFSVEEVNKSCPMFVDEITRLDYAEIDKDGFFHYVYTFPSLSKSDIDIPSFYKEQSDILNNGYESLTTFKENDVTVRYTYFDMHDNQIISILIPNN